VPGFLFSNSFLSELLCFRPIDSPRRNPFSHIEFRNTQGEGVPIIVNYPLWLLETTS